MVSSAAGDYIPKPPVCQSAGPRLRTRLDHSQLPESLYFGKAAPELAEHLVGVLSQHRRRQPVANASVAQMRRESEGPDHARHRMLEDNDELSSEYLRVAQSLIQQVDRPAGYIRLA
jgi:hypothetical protein